MLSRWTTPEQARPIPCQKPVYFSIHTFRLSSVEKRQVSLVEEGLKGAPLRKNAPIGVPADSEPYDPLVWKDRPEEVEDEEEISPCPCDEAVKFGGATSRFGWG